MELYSHVKSHHSERKKAVKGRDDGIGDSEKEDIGNLKDNDASNPDNINAETDQPDGEAEAADADEDDSFEREMAETDRTVQMKKKSKKKRPTNHAAKIETDGQKNQWRICSICGKYLVNDKALTRHMETHKDAKDLTCEYCDKQFLTTKTLYSHRRLHRSKGRFPCEICNRYFRTS